MTKQIVSRTLGCLSALFMGLWSQTLHAQIVDITDPGLQSAVRAALDKPTGDITVSDMESLIELDASRLARGGALL